MLEIIKKRGEPGVIFIFYLAARLCNKGGGGSSGKFRENLLESYLASLPRVSAARQVYESSRPLSSATSLPRYNFRGRKRESSSASPLPPTILPDKVVEITGYDGQKTTRGDIPQRLFFPPSPLSSFFHSSLQSSSRAIFLFSSLFEDWKKFQSQKSF